MPSLQRFATLFFTVILYAAVPALAANYPDPKESRWVARDFKFHTGEVMPEVTLFYRIIGSPANEAALVLHGTAGNGGNIATYNAATPMMCCISGNRRAARPPAWIAPGAGRLRTGRRRRG